MQDDETAARLCVSNAKGETGKTTVAINVAGALNERGRDVQLIEQIAALEEGADITVDTVGVVANRVEQTNEDAMMLEWLEEVFSDFPVWQIRKRVALQQAFSAGTSVFAYEGSVDVSAVFLDIASRIDRQFGYTELKA